MANNVEFHTSLDDKSYRNTIYWNTFCRKKALFLILVIMYAYGMFSVAMILRRVDVSNQNVLFALAVSFLCVILPVINVGMMERRIRKTIKQRDIPTDSLKRIHINENQIEVYKIEKKEHLSFSWDDVDGVYATPEQVILCMKNNMLIPMNKGQAKPDQMGWVIAMAEEKNLIRTGMKFSTIRMIIIVITGLTLILGTPVGK